MSIPPTPKEVNNVMEYLKANHLLPSFGAIEAPLCNVSMASFEPQHEYKHISARMRLRLVVDRLAAICSSDGGSKKVPDQADLDFLTEKGFAQAPAFAKALAQIKRLVPPSNAKTRLLLLLNQIRKLLDAPFVTRGEGGSSSHKSSLESVETIKKVFLSQCPPALPSPRNALPSPGASPSRSIAEGNPASPNARRSSQEHVSTGLASASASASSPSRRPKRRLSCVSINSAASGSNENSSQFQQNMDKVDQCHHNLSRIIGIASPAKEDRVGNVYRANRAAALAAPPSPHPAVSSESALKKRRRFTPEEDKYLQLGVNEIGLGAEKLWSAILAKYPERFDRRSNVDLKDRWRNLSKK